MLNQAATEFLGVIEQTAPGFVIFVVAALCIGSFLNTVISRLPQMVQKRERDFALNHLHITTTNVATPNLFRPRSQCPRCRTQIKIHHLLPVVSYLLLKGRCASCRQTISSRYLWVEISAACLLLLTMLQFGLSIAFVFYGILVCILLVLTVIDWEQRTLPDELTYPLLWLGLLFAAFWPVHATTSLTNSILGATVGYLALWVINTLFQKLRDRPGMGYGDFKLTAALGAWVGLIDLLLVVIVAAVSGLLFALILLSFGKYRNDIGIPFGPFLAIGAILVLFFPPIRAIV